MDMNTLIFITALFGTAMTQRPFYAGSSSKGYPELHTRFQNTDTVANESDGTVQVNNRLGESDPNSNPDIPTDARGDVALVNRLNQWPRENQPFWLINAEHIERHRHPEQDPNRQILQTNINNQNTQFQSRFGGAEVVEESRPVRGPEQRPLFAGQRGRNNT